MTKEIDDNLRRAYSHALDAQVPEQFRALIARIRNSEPERRGVAADG